MGIVPQIGVCTVDGLSYLGSLAMNAVATAVAVSMSRELGPLITAIVVIGRSDSAFAAELGTKKK